MGLVWPWSVVAPLNPFHAVEYFSSFFEKPWRELFDGQLILVPDMPRSYVPTLFALQIPELMLVLGLCGLCRRHRGGRAEPGASAGRRAALLAVLLVATLPIMVTVVTRPYMYNGVRHFVFMLPPLAVLGGLAAAWIGTAAGAARCRGDDRRCDDRSPPELPLRSIEMVRLHPYQYTYLQSHRRRRGRRAAQLHGRTIGGCR